MISCIPSALASLAQQRIDSALGAAEPQLEWRANQIDFAVASRLDQVHDRFLRPRRGVESLTHRLEAQVEALTAFSGQLPADAGAELETRKEHLTWLLSELRRGG